MDKQLQARNSTYTLKTYNSSRAISHFPVSLSNTPGNLSDPTFHSGSLLVSRERSGHHKLSWIKKIKSIASNIIKNIKPRSCIRPLPIENIKNITQNENEGKKKPNTSSQIIFPYISSGSWNAPLTHGLENSPRIIPDYYLSTCMNHDTNVLQIDYKYIILDDIRNLRKLSDYQIKYIKNMNNEDKQEIIEEYNLVVEAFLSTL